MASTVEEARQAFLDALEEAGIDRTTADAQTRYMLPSEPTIVGNYADLQRMGAAATTGSIPTGPTLDNVDSSDLSEAFTMPPDPALREQVGNEGGAASVPTPTAPDTQAGQATPADGGSTDLNSMTKAELADHASSQGISGVDPGNMTKQEMIDTINSGGA
jgi:hypothetical protein